MSTDFCIAIDVLSSQSYILHNAIIILTDQANKSLHRFKVEDSQILNDDLAAWACIRLDRLQSGYRFINLLDEKGVATPGILLVKIEKKFR